MSWKSRARRGTATSVPTLIKRGEGARLEFKQSLEADSRGAKDPKTLDGVLKTIVAFLNTDGGTLLIGVSDSGQIRGLGLDYALLGKRQDTDGFEQKLRNLIRAHLKPLSLRSIAIRFEALPEGTICRVDVAQSSHPVYLNEKEVYVRDGNTTRKLEGPDLARWLSDQNTRRRRRIIPIVALGIILIALLAYYFPLEFALAVPIRPSRAGLDEPLKPCAVPAAPPENSEARRLYTEGCQKINKLDYPSARSLFEKAVSIEPQRVHRAPECARPYSPC